MGAPVGKRGTFSAPVFDIFMGLLTALAGPMIFLSVAGGIYNIGDIATLGKIGKRMTGRFLWMTLVLTAVFGMVTLPFFPLAHRGGSAFRLSELLEMVLGIVPDNFFTPFTEGNPLQIIYCSWRVSVPLFLSLSLASGSWHRSRASCNKKDRSFRWCGCSYLP